MKNVRVELVMVSVRDRRSHALLVRLPGNVWVLPGVEVPSGTTLEAAAHAVLADQTGVRDVALEQLYSFDRDGGGGRSASPIWGWWRPSATR